MLDLAMARLESFGYALQNGDEAILGFCVEKVTNTIKNDCNVDEVPEGLMHIAVDMAVGEFLKAKKTFAPDSLSASGLDLSAAVKQIQAGDTNVTFATGESSQTDEERLDDFISRLLSYGRGEFACYRRLRW